MREGEIGPVGKADLSRTVGALREGITQAEGNEGEDQETVTVNR